MVITKKWLHKVGHDQLTNLLQKPMNKGNNPSWSLGHYQMNNSINKQKI